jgi:hypothetical protein
MSIYKLGDDHPLTTSFLSSLTEALKKKNKINSRNEKCLTYFDATQ